VDYVASGSRFKLLIPKENVSLTLVLSGIRAPRTARNASEKSEPYGVESLEFASRRYMQRDVEVDFEATDKTGGFIGALYLNKTENVAVTLVREGRVDPFICRVTAGGPGDRRWGSPSLSPRA
jgi:staphylococcal nuclease domain-containing protein 1